MSLASSSVHLIINSSLYSVSWFIFVCIWQGLWSYQMFHKLHLGCLRSAFFTNWVIEYTWAMTHLYSRISLWKAEKVFPPIIYTQNYTTFCRWLSSVNFIGAEPSPHAGTVCSPVWSSQVRVSTSKYESMVSCWKMADWSLWVGELSSQARTFKHFSILLMVQSS